MDFDDGIKSPRRGRPRPPSEFASDDMRNALRRMVDPEAMAAFLISVVDNPGATYKDRLAAAQMIMNRRDGMPTQMVLTAHASFDRALKDVPDALLGQIESLLVAQQRAQLAASNAEYDAAAIETTEAIEGDETE